jgi:hypothetical protein
MRATLFGVVRPAWAHSYGWKSRHKGSVERICGPMNKNRIEGRPEQRERANDREEALVTTV